MEKPSNKNLIWWFLGAGVLGLGVGVWLIHGIRRRHKRKILTESNDKISWTFSSFAAENPKTLYIENYSFEQAVKYVKNIVRDEQSKGQLSAKTIILINELAINRIKCDFLVLYKKNRESRRNKISSIEKYCEEHIKGSRECEQLQIDGLSTIAHELELSYRFFNEEVSRLIINNPDLNNQLKHLYQNIKLDLVADSIKSNISTETVIAMYRYQLEIFDDYNFGQISIIDKDMVITLKKSFIGDLTSLKFGIEEEHLIFNLSLMENAEVIRLQTLLEKKALEEQQRMINFDY